MRENVWISMSKINCDLTESIYKKNVSFMKSICIGYLIAEIDFKTGPLPVSQLIFNIPELKENFDKCEVTIFATKNQDTASLINISLEPGKLTANSYPFEPNSYYEMNIQMMVKII